MKTILLRAFLIGLAGTALLTEAAAAKPSVVSTGNDVSYPQCGKTLPAGQTFGIVGVNGGLATTGNSCFAPELQWAYGSSGLVNQPKAQLYLNTGNPGGLSTASWPKNNTDPAKNLAPNPYGTCDASNSLACSWQYGWNRTVEDIVNRFAPAAQTAGILVDPSEYPWW